MGLLGTYNQNPNDDFVTPDCQTVATTFYPPTPQEMSRLYYDFGLKCEIFGSRNSPQSKLNSDLFRVRRSKRPSTIVSGTLQASLQSTQVCG